MARKVQNEVEALLKELEGFKKQKNASSSEAKKIRRTLRKTHDYYISKGGLVTKSEKREKKAAKAKKSRSKK